LGVIEHTKGVKCTTYGASYKGELAFGDFSGYLNIIDLETRKIFYSVKAHDQIINCIDGFGG